MVKALTHSRLTQIDRIGSIESISLLILLLIAMPMKYIWDDPRLVRWVGMAHGVLFIAYVAVVVRAHAETRWKMSYTFWGVVASFIPFGPAIFVKKMRAQAV
jgi:integral membrane protein